VRARTALILGACCLVAIGGGTTAAALVTARHTETHPTGAAAASSTAAPTTARTPAPAASLSPADTRLLEYVGTLPGVTDVTRETVDEFTELTCATLRSPNMSPAFYSQVVAIERKGYGLTADQADGLLAASARAACPDASRVVSSHGAETATAPVG
jgi:hypothetical protein